jgi:hypothetical protein
MLKRERITLTNSHEKRGQPAHQQPEYRHRPRGSTRCWRMTHLQRFQFLRTLVGGRGLERWNSNSPRGARFLNQKEPRCCGAYEEFCMFQEE